MKKGKRILAMAGVVLLAALYISTLVCALCGSDNTMNLLMASIYGTVVVPALIWAYQLIYKLIKKNADENEKASGGDFSDKE